MNVKHHLAPTGAALSLWQADCRDTLKQLSSNSIDSCVSDPPYALVSTVKRFGGENAAPPKAGTVYARAAAGFMGKTWDTGETAFAVEFWREMYRVLKPGAYVLAFSGTRTYHRLACAIEDAGFEIRDQIGWMYATGFPKGLDVSKAFDKAAGHWRGRSAGPVSGNASLSGGNYARAPKGEPITHLARVWDGWNVALKPSFEPIVVARKPLVGTVIQNVETYRTGALNVKGCRVGDDKWPSNMLHDGSLGVERVFADRAEFFFCPKISDTDRDHGLIVGQDGARANVHPTVKPTELMRYLCRLVTPPHGVVLDPFMGSGSTGRGALLEGFGFIGIEREAEYWDIANARVGVLTK